MYRKHTGKIILIIVRILIHSYSAYLIQRCPHGDLNPPKLRAPHKPHTRLSRPGIELNDYSNRSMQDFEISGI
jgi:hypothetical protein